MKKNPAECLSIILKPPNLHKQQAEQRQGHSPTFTPSWLFPPVELLPESWFHIQSTDTSPTSHPPPGQHRGTSQSHKLSMISTLPGSRDCCVTPIFPLNR